MLVAITISAIAAWYSVAGLTAIFSAAVIPVIIMGGALEAGKLVATVWLHNNWRRAGWAFKTYLIPAIVFLMLLTSMGIFGFLSKAHSDQSLVTGDAVSKVAIYDEKIATERENVAQAKKALEQMNAQVDQMLGRTDTERGTERAVVIRKQQAKERAALQTEIAKSQKIIQQLQAERAPFAAEARKVEAEVGPIKYIAALIYGDNPDQNILERAVRWVIILIVIVFDPLALTLILAANKQFEWARQGKGGWVHEDEAAQNINPDPPGVEQRPFAPEEIAALDDADKKIDPDLEADEFFERAQLAAKAADMFDEQHRAEQANNEMTKIERPEDNLDIPVLENEEMWASRVIDEHQQQAKYEADKANCTNIAMTYSLTDERLIKAGYVAVIAGSSVAGIALIAGYGVLNPIAIPFIVGATLVGAGVGSMSPEERLARENILYQCLAKHGYTVYSPNAPTVNIQPESPVITTPKTTLPITTEQPTLQAKPLSLEEFKAQCNELGFKTGTTDYGMCVLQLDRTK